MQNDAGGLFQARGLVRFYRFTPPLDGPGRRTLPKDTAEGHCGDINRLISFISTNYIFDFRIDANNDWNNDK